MPRCSSATAALLSLGLGCSAAASAALSGPHRRLLDILTASAHQGHSNSMNLVETGATLGGSSAKALSARASTSSARTAPVLGTGMVRRWRHLGQLAFLPASVSLTPRIV